MHCVYGAPPIRICNKLIYSKNNKLMFIEVK